MLTSKDIEKTKAKERLKEDKAFKTYLTNRSKERRKARATGHNKD